MTKLKEYEVSYEYGPHYEAIMVVEATSKLEAKKIAEKELAQYHSDAQIGQIYRMKEESKRKQSVIEEELRQKLAQKDEYIRDLESRISKIKKLSENA